MRIFLLIFCMLASPAFAAIGANAVWEIRPSNGADTNGGAYVWGGGVSLSSKTDLAINASNSAVVSSSSYGFTSSDVGRYIKITAGTGFTAGYYYISAVTSGNATLDRSAGALSSTSGSFTIYSGIDYSRQNSVNSSGVNISTTDAVTAGTTTITSATANFTADIVGNVIYVAGGTGSITGGWYQVTGFTNSTTITVDRSTGLTAGTGATLNIGGALKTLSKWSGVYTASNKAYMKAESTQTTSSTIVLSTSGTGGADVQLIGYTTTRGDNGKVTIQASAGVSVNGVVEVTANQFSIYNFTFDANSQTTSSGVRLNGTYNSLYNSLVKNFTAYGIYASCYACTIQNNEVTGGNGTAGIASISSEGPVIVGNYVHDNAAVGIELGGAGGGVAAFNIVYNNSGSTSNGISAPGSGGGGSILFNTIDASGENGIYYDEFFPATIQGNIISNSGHSTGTNASTAYGLAGAGAYPASPVYDGNAYYNNLSGNRNNMDDQGITTPLNGAAPYITTLDVSLTASPYVSQPSNWALNTTAGGGAACVFAAVPTSWPNLNSTVGAPSFGAVQPARSVVIPTVGYGG